MSTFDVENKLEISLEKNIQLCLNFGYGTLKSAKSDMEYRNAIISIHNGLELLMKLYLKCKDEHLIYENIDYAVLLSERSDLIKVVDKKKLHTIKFSECIKILSYFEEIPEESIKKLNEIRNNFAHYQCTAYKHEVKKILIVYIYPFIKRLVKTLCLELTDFISEKHIESLEKSYKYIHDAIRMKFIEKIEIAKKHYFEELNDLERNEKQEYNGYKCQRPNKIVKCPACTNKALLKIKLSTTKEREGFLIIVNKSFTLSSLTCYHCGLIINERDELLIKYESEEKSFSNSYYAHDCPDDCADDCDCPDDCADDCDCSYDCADDCDCPDDCADDCDCPDDCADDCDCSDCPDDCDCADCPEDC